MRLKILRFLFVFVFLALGLLAQNVLACGDDSCPTCPTCSFPGKITVCKAIQGQAPAGESFSVNLGFATTVFNTPLSLNADLLENDGVKDAQCVTYNNLPYGQYHYLQEVNPSTGWETPLYSDDGTTNFSAYGSSNSSGVISITADKPERILIVLNKVKPCPAPIRGCTDHNATNYNPNATEDDGTCQYPCPNCNKGKITVCKIVQGSAPTGEIFSVNMGFATATFTTTLTGVSDCIVYDNLPYGQYHYSKEENPYINWEAPLYSDDGATSYSPYGENGSSDGLIQLDESHSQVTLTVVNKVKPCFPTSIRGCTDHRATNYNPNATIDDGTCQYPPTPGQIYGCTDHNALNYNPHATVNDGSCRYPPVIIYGCMDRNADNYNPNATADDGSCHHQTGMVWGCTDPRATNYNRLAEIDDGSCVYPGTLSPQLTIDKSIGQDSAKPGDTVTYKIVVKNIGSVAANNVRVRDALPDGFQFVDGVNGEWNLGNLAINAPSTLTYRVKVPQNASAGTFTNTARAWADNNPSISDTASLKILEVEETHPILTVTKTSSLDQVKPGTYFVYTLKVTNTGNAPALNVVLEDNLPSGFLGNGGLTKVTWNIPVINQGASVVEVLTAYVESTTKAGNYENIATAYAENNPNKVSAKNTVRVVNKLPHTGSSLFENWPFILGILSLALSLAGLIKFPTKRKTFSFAALGVSLIVLSYPLWPLIGYAIFPIPQIAEKDIPSFQKENSVVIPKIGVDMPIVQGEDDSALEKGAWLLPGSPSPDQLENTSLAAHRYKYRPPAKTTFYLLDKLETGDWVLIFWKGREYRYQVVSSVVVNPNDDSVLEAGTEPFVTLITCTPLFSDKYRLVVKAKLVDKM